jgi:hypothetical protein
MACFSFRRCVLAVTDFIGAEVVILKAEATKTFIADHHQVQLPACKYNFEGEEEQAKTYFGTYAGSNIL